MVQYQNGKYALLQHYDANSHLQVTSGIRFQISIHLKRQNRRINRNLLCVYFLAIHYCFHEPYIRKKMPGNVLMVS